MSAKIIAVANMKGGVGKTATVVSLAEAFAAGGKRVLVIDLDAQANASICLAGDKILAMLMARKATIEGFLEDSLLGPKKLSIRDCIRDHVSNVSNLGEQLPISLLPSSPELRNFEQRLIFNLTHAKMSWSDIVEGLWGVLEKNFQKVRKDFDLILIDCAPGISVLTEVSVRLADLVVIPTIADFLSTFGLQQFCATLSHRGIAPKRRRATQLPYVLVTRRRQVKIHNETIDKLRNEQTADEPSFKMFVTEIPEAVAIADALSKITQYPSFLQKWGTAVTPILSDLAQEIDGVLHGNRT